ncbi:MAG: hypothetical protein JJ896_01190 [Rhodothermales bacterium]|nr:hypothetical protein [Rhodothermales bacterium]MBO6778243.1 hypothetical protein [Rhodothermales bacterium]
MNKNLFAAACALLLTTGAVVFLWGGAQHPSTGSSLGPVGSPEYFRAFARHVADHVGWREIHSGILAGPILWALGTVGLADRFSLERQSNWSMLALLSLSMGAATWAVVFVLDGFVAPLQAEAILAAGSSIDAVHAFRSNQEIVIRLGLVSWLLIGVGIASISAAARTAGEQARLIRFVLVPGGFLVGLWPLVAWIMGPFRPGPFTSGTWAATAILTSAWFVVASVVLVRKRSTQAGGAA